MQRTNKQNNSEHKMFENVARQCNERGIDQKILFEDLSDYVEIPNTKQSIKQVFRLIAAALYPENMKDGASTTKLSTVETQHVYRVFAQYFAKQHGINVDWPSYEPPAISDYIEHSKRQV